MQSSDEILVSSAVDYHSYCHYRRNSKTKTHQHKFIEFSFLETCNNLIAKSESIFGWKFKLKTRMQCEKQNCKKELKMKMKIYFKIEKKTTKIFKWNHKG